MSENEDFASEELDSDLVASDLSEVDEDIDDEDEVTDEEADFESDDDEDLEEDDDDGSEDESDDDSDDDSEVESDHEGEFDDDDESYDDFEESDDDSSAASDSSASEVGAQVLSGPVFAFESLPVTGEARVDDALGRLGDLEGLPVSDHPGVFEDVQRRLHDTLADLAGS